MNRAARGKILWTPPPAAARQSNMSAFVDFVNKRRGLELPYEYAPLHRWSVRESENFWSDFWDFAGIVGDKGGRPAEEIPRPPYKRFFPDGKLSFAENFLQNADSRPAVIEWNENGKQKTTSRAELREQTLRLAGCLQNNGVGAGDCIGAVLPNKTETVAALLAASALGAVFSSCSPDFGAEGVLSRLGQIRPKALIAAAQYVYGGKVFCRRAEMKQIISRLPSLQTVIVTEEDAPPKNVLTWEETQSREPLTSFVQTPFNAPLAVLYSSGTTGAPKCIVHSAGGTLLQHRKELSLHCNLQKNDKAFYFTTCGWMMWNWLVGALAAECAVVLYDGNPMTPPEILWEMAEAENVALFGASAKYFSAMQKNNLAPKTNRNLKNLRLVCSTGSPLSADNYSYIYESVKSDVQLASISGGTDIVSCFVLGNPFSPVRAGEIQCAGLGMAAEIFGEDGKAVFSQAGELVCTAAAPCMPLGFWNDSNGEKYRAAYWQKFPRVWTHGDRATQHKDGAFVIHGRSDATLNPGGVRIGTAEIYRYVEQLEEVAEALAVGQQIGDDERIVLFVRLQSGAALTDKLRDTIKSMLRKNATPRHIPAKIIAVADFPRTRSGKISEIAARETIHNRPVNNTQALANPEALALFANLPDLAT